MVSSITNINPNSSKIRFKNLLTSFSLIFFNNKKNLPFHIISWLIKISNPRYMKFSMFSQKISFIINNHRCIMQSSFHLISFQNRINNNHIIFFRQFAQKISSHPSLGWLREFNPWVHFSGAKEKRSIKTFLDTQHIGPLQVGCLNYHRYSVQQSISLVDHTTICGFDYHILNGSDSY